MLGLTKIPSETE
jgi:hypothetical protein